MFRNTYTHTHTHTVVLLCHNSSLSRVLDHTTKNFRLLEPLDGPSWSSVDSRGCSSVEQKEG